MSGTSLDGIDAALCKIEGSGKKTRIELVAFDTYPLREALVQKIRLSCFSTSSSVDMICSLNFELGHAFSDAVTMILKKAGLKDEDLSFIASHGQTIYHQPVSDASHMASTLQIGEPAVMAYEHHCPVVSNFRVMDMAAGGQGAPLVPYSEYILYGSMHVNKALLNLGGIGNITWLDGSMDPSNILAFDTGPGNMMINAAMKLLYQMPYDENGRIAAGGQLVKSLLWELKKDPYFELQPPKSTGRELFGEDRTKALLEKYQDEKKEDLVHTFTYFTAWSVAYHVEKYLSVKKPLDVLLVSGGGVHNQTIMSMLRQLLPDVRVMSQEDIGANSDAKEAIAFVILGNETLHGNPSNVMSATGAKRAVVLGNITPWPGKVIESCECFGKGDR